MSEYCKHGLCPSECLQCLNDECEEYNEERHKLKKKLTEAFILFELVLIDGVNDELTGLINDFQNKEKV